MKKLLVLTTTMLLSLTCFASDSLKDLKKANEYLSDISHNAATVKKLADHDDRKGACIIARDDQAYGFGGFAQSYQLAALDSWVLKELPIDVGAEEEKLHCRIDLIKSFCAKSYGYDSKDYSERLSRSGSCTELVRLNLPTTLKDLSYQALILNTEAKRLIKILNPKLN